MAVEWSDRGIVLSLRKHGESSAIVSLLTRAHGVHGGLVRGGTGKRARGDLQPGNLLDVHWRARLEDHLGAYKCEMIEAYSAAVLDRPGPLAALSAACALSLTALPERESHPPIFDALTVLLGHLHRPHWAALYVRWELGFLAQTGFPLDLTRCAASGVTEDLVFVSPKSGRAVCAAEGRPYRDKLLELPPFLRPQVRDGSAFSRHEIAAGLRLTAFFLGRFIYDPMGRPLPDARLRLAQRFVSP
ncbi:DNA repair protein RecO [Varunaivibrio sulfuroxidans]|uniref:DNA repair protein RecO n=1 Tax=Varunaivibrio sulfuroxidans TaxID=1773489 RepID=A0A4R3JEC6_9PROT|nr:DNA repair protein RecO [Varunaivibrio sulfuroxidans]TCS64232.1 DNA replication and repair protein RecO [Varunaivibrio sulfuroxidans]WES31327.1 DNA repair protein RecO [Varunaivibrio sulfuroxidans]